jgi:LacI family gluconate utilization system Gnt-I transcriptional repressor
LAGVAPITVSRALNQPNTVAKDTFSKVWAAIDQIGYVPNRLAGSLASNNSRTIGMVLPYIINPAFAERVQGVTDVMSAAGYTLLLGLSAYSPEAELEHVISFLGQRVAGLVLTGTVHADRTRSLLSGAGIPVVEVPLISGRLIDMAVGYSNESAGYEMTKYLARCGYRKIGLLSTPVLNDQIVLDRLTGYDRALSEFGLVKDPTMILESKVGIVNGAKAFVELLSRHPDIEAIFCTSDVHAIGCVLEAKRRGIDVPGDIGIAGYDDIELAQEFLPPLTTVRLPRYEIGRTSAELLLQRIRGEKPTLCTIDLGFEIIPRGSTRKPKK